jgi:Uma2 family endonuclease
MATQIRAAHSVAFRRFSADEYHRLGESGVLGARERVELLDGFLIDMPPIGYRHEYVSSTLANLIVRALGNDEIIRANSPISLCANSEPQPDVIVLRGPSTRYRDRLPGPADILLLIEVADSSRAYDRGPKAQVYAQAGVEEVWIVDLVAAEVLVLREPGAQGYDSTAVLRRGERLASARVPGVVIAVSAFLDAAAQP